MSKSEMWSLLQTVSDNIAILSAQVDFVSDMVASRNKAMEEHGTWGVKNTRILSTRIPNEIANRWDEVMLCENLSTSSVLRVLVEDFVDEYNPIDKGLFFVPKIPLAGDVRHECSAENPAENSADCPRDNRPIVPRDKLLAEVEQALAFASSEIEKCI